MTAETAMSKSTIFVGVLAVGALAVAGGSGFYTYMMTKPAAAVKCLKAVLKRDGCWA